MEYIDTGSRDPAQALGSWLRQLAGKEHPITHLRWQSGFFGAGSLSFLQPLLEELEGTGGTLTAVIGSNDGGTRAEDLRTLLQAADSIPTVTIAVASFRGGYFHPKTVHVQRSDGGAAAYVGSANLTQAGTSSLHIEAGILLESGLGDSTDVLTSIAAAVDWWFADERDGLHVIENESHLSDLASRGLIDVPHPKPVYLPATTSAPTAIGGATRSGVLKHLVALPSGAEQLTDDVDQPAVEPERIATPALGERSEIELSPTAATWAKRLSQSDAQRKPTGNQRGSITLVQAGYPINAQTYFRRELFGRLAWEEQYTRTGKLLEAAVVFPVTTVLGEALGPVRMMVTHDPSRESEQANYTSLLHLGELSPYFSETDMTGKVLEIRLLSDGSYTLEIRD